MKISVTEQFIEGLIIRSHKISIKARNKARYCLLDYLGVAVGGFKYNEKRHPDLLSELKKETGSYSVFGNCAKTSEQSATLLNGFCAHVLELDDGHRHGMIHLGASIISSVLAAAEKEKLSSECVLCGIVMGYEVAVRCARSIQPGHKVRGYHVSGTCGTIGTAIGIAFACGYNKEQLKSTLSCAVTSAAGLLEIQEQASELKPFNIGHAAVEGLLAAKIGKLAIPGPDDVLGGKRGFLAALTDTPHPEFLTVFNDVEYAIEGIYQKVHAACRHCHPAIDATLDIQKELKIQPEEIDKIEVHTYKLAVGSHDHTDIRGISSAKLSTPFAVALAIAKGSAGFADYNEDNLNDYWIKNLTRKVSVIEDDDLTRRSPDVRAARVTIYLKDGRVFEAPCMYPKGEPENPLTQDEFENKFRGLATYGGLTKSECDEVLCEMSKEDFSISKILGIVCRE